MAAIGNSEAHRAPAVWWLLLALVPLFASQVMRAAPTPCSELACLGLWRPDSRSRRPGNYSRGTSCRLSTRAEPVSSPRNRDLDRSNFAPGAFESVAAASHQCSLSRDCRRCSIRTRPAGLYPIRPRLRSCIGGDQRRDHFRGDAFDASRSLCERRRPRRTGHVSRVRRLSLVGGDRGNVLLATTMGVLLMVMYRRSGALLPVVLAHYVVDLIAFAVRLCGSCAGL